MKKLLIMLAFTLVASVSNAQFNGSATVIAQDDKVEVEKSGNVTFDVLCNDTYISTSTDSITVTIDENTINGILNDNGDGSFDYTNSGNYNNDTITYTLTHINSGNTSNGTVYIYNTSTNNAPIANDTSIIVDSTKLGKPLNIDISNLISDGNGDLLSIVKVILNDSIYSFSIDYTNTTKTYNDTIHRTTTISGTTITYTPKDTLWLGYDTLTYIITDGNGGYDTAFITIQNGSIEQINSYNIISPYFNTPLTTGGLNYTNSLSINSDGTTDQTGYEDPISTLGSIWTINSDGTIEFKINITNIIRILYVSPYQYEYNTFWYYGFNLDFDNVPNSNFNYIKY